MHGPVKKCTAYNRTYNTEHHGTFSEIMKVTNRTYNSEHHDDTYHAINNKLLCYSYDVICFYAYIIKPSCDISYRKL